MTALPAGIVLRHARETDLGMLRVLMAAAIDTLQQGFLTPAQIAASRQVMGLDTQPVCDGTYLIAKAGGTMVGCGGWSRRATLYGGDHSAGLRDAALLDPATGPARIRAMYTHPDHARRGIGRLILAACEAEAAAAGFAAAELMATLSGEPLYRAAGYRPVERIEAPVETGAKTGAKTGVVTVPVPLIRMRKPLTG